MSSNTLQYCKRGDYAGSFQELPNNVRILTPTGDEYIIRWDHVKEGIVLSKQFAEDGNTAMSVHPCVSNEILIK